MTDMKRASRRKFNPCTHEKGRLLTTAALGGGAHHASPYQYWDSVDNGSQAWYLSDNVAVRRAKEYVANFGDKSMEDPEQLASYMKKLIKKPPEVLSLLNFLAELKDVKHMFYLWSSKLSKLHNLANIRLGYEYGWKLFLQDVVTLLDALYTVQKRIKSYLDKQGEVQKNRLRVRLLEDNKGIGSTTVGSAERFMDMTDPGYPGFSFVLEDAFVVRKFYEVVNIRYSYFLPELSACSAQLGLLLGAFGIEWNPRIIWDAIPYSFVIDWFLSVGDFIEDWLAHDNVPIHVRVHDFSVTRYCSVLSSVRYSWVSDIFSTPVKKSYHNIVCEGSYYKRVVDLQNTPTVEHLINAGFSRLGKSRMLNGLSLIIANTRMSGKPMPRKKPSSKKKRNPLLEKRDRREFRFVWPERPWLPKYSKSFKEDFRFYKSETNNNGQRIDGSDPRYNTAWAVRYERLKNEAGAKIFIR